jgi:hypothetical protein
MNNSKLSQILFGGMPQQRPTAAMFQGMNYPQHDMPPHAQTAAMLGAVGAGPVAMTKPGNIDIFNRPRVPMADGSVATVRSMSFRNNKGEEILIPTVGPNGEDLTPQQAKELYGRTGKHLGKFSSPEAANHFAWLLHLQQEKMYGGKKP